VRTPSPKRKLVHRPGEPSRTLGKGIVESAHHRVCDDLGLT